MKRTSVMAGVGMFAAIGLVAAGLAMKKRAMLAEAAAAPAMEPPMAVAMAEAKSTSWQPTADLMGTVFAWRSVTLQNEVGGLVRFVGFESGQVVEAGQVLVRLDDTTETAELRTAEAAMRVAQADVSVSDTRLRLAESEFRRQDEAARSKAVSALELDRAKAEVQRMTAEQLRAQASVEENAAKVARVKTQLEKYVIVAPFRARVGLRAIHQGQFLSPPMGSFGTPIATLHEVSDNIYIDFPVPQEYLGRVREGMVVMGVLEAEGGPGGGGPGAPIRLEVAAVDAAADNATRNVRVRAMVDNRDGRLRPGMFVKLRVPTDQARSFVVVPVSAVRRASYADQVFVVKDVQEKGPDGKPQARLRASQRFVKLGPVIGDDVIVLDGLKAGERIAASGSFKLREGALVMEAPPPVAAAGKVEAGTKE